MNKRSGLADSPFFTAPANRNTPVALPAATATDAVIHQTAVARILETEFTGSANNVTLTLRNLTLENGKGGTAGEPYDGGVAPYDGVEP